MVFQLVKQKAVFHKTCTNKHDSYNFKLKVKTKKKLIHHHLIQLKLLVLLGEFCPHQILLITVFFFFTQTDDAVNFHQCQTLPLLDKHVGRMTHELIDTKLLAKLSEGEMMVTEVKYLQDYTMPIVITT